MKGPDCRLKCLDTPRLVLLTGAQQTFLFFSHKRHRVFKEPS